MAFNALVKDLVSTAFTIVDDLGEKITFQKHVGQTYDIDTGLPTEDLTTFLNIPAVMARFTERELDETVNVLTDVKCLIPAKDLAAIVDKDDEIIRPDGSSWDVIKVMGVPGDSLWMLQIRKR